MSLRLDHPDLNGPSTMSPDDRRDELASIFARALLRIPRRRGDDEEVDQIAADSAHLGLEVSATTRPHRAVG